MTDRALKARGLRSGSQVVAEGAVEQRLAHVVAVHPFKEGVVLTERGFRPLCPDCEFDVTVDHGWPISERRIVAEQDELGEPVQRTREVWFWRSLPMRQLASHVRLAHVPAPLTPEPPNAG